MDVDLEDGPRLTTNQVAESHTEPRGASSKTDSTILARAFTDEDYDKLAEMLVEVDERLTAEYSCGDMEGYELAG